MATELATAYISLVPSAKGIKGNIERELGGLGVGPSRSIADALARAGADGGRRIANAIRGVRPEMPEVGTRIPELFRSAATKAGALFSSGVKQSTDGLGDDVGEKFTRDINGRLRDSRGRYVAEGKESGGLFSRSFSGHLDFGGVAGKLRGALVTGAKAAAVGVAGVFSAGVVGAKVALGAASDYNESLSKIGAVFGPEQQAEIQKWADGAAKAFGQSKTQALEAAGTYGNLLTSFGLNADASADMSKNLTVLASDLASFNNTSPQEALDALRSGLTGETEPLKRYGIALDDASLKAKALALGIADGKSVLTPAQKAQAAYALIMERSTNAQGDFARTSSGAANQQRIFAARIEDLKVKVGQALLPALNAILPVLSNLFDRIGPLIDRALPMLRRGFEAISEWWTQNGPAIMATAKQVLDALVAGFQAVSSWVVDNWPTISEVISNVIGTVRTVIEGAVSVITTLWKNFGDNILSFVQRAWPPIKQVVEGVLTTVRGIIQTITSLIKGDWSGVWEGIKGIFSGVWNALQGIVKTALEAVRLVIGAALEVIGSAWKGIWEGLTNFVRDKIDAVAGFFTDLPGRLARVGSGMFDFIKESFRAALNFVIRGWNSLEFRIPGFDPPGPGPTFAGFTLGVPDIPEFHDGGVVPGRPGQEVLALLKAGERVLTPEQQMGGGVVINANGLTAQEAADYIPRAIAWQTRGLMGPG